MATNHFGPFLLTGLLLPQVTAAGGRVVTVSSNMHKSARSAPLGDPHRQEGPYRKWRVYAGTKLANLLFTFELDRRCRAAGLPVKALAAHPGFAGSHLVANGRFGRAAGGPAAILDAAVRAARCPAPRAWSPRGGSPWTATPSDGCGRSARTSPASSTPDSLSGGVPGP
jgi:NAD(P)-dependent dehydrogenase (short-subunit alcohol dehydrogenase family)